MIHTIRWFHITDGDVIDLSFFVYVLLRVFVVSIFFFGFSFCTVIQNLRELNLSIFMKAVEIVFERVTCLVLINQVYR